MQGFPGFSLPGLPPGFNPFLPPSSTGDCLIYVDIWGEDGCNMNMMVVVLLSSMSPSSQCLPRRKAVDACSRRRRHSTASFTKEGQRSGHLPYTNHLQLLFHILSIVVFSSISFDLERNSLPEMAPSYCPSPHNLPKMLSHLCILSIYNVSPFLFYVSPVFPEIPH